jgi:hypothetical protein
MFLKPFSGAMTFSIMTLSKKDLFVTLSINDIQHKSHSEKHSVCHYAECRDLCIIMLNVTMLSVVMPNVVAPFFLVIFSCWRLDLNPQSQEE